MDLGLSEEQVLIRNSLQRFTRDNYSLKQRIDNATSARGFSAGVWQQFAELGWLGIPFPEALGGFGGSIIDAALVMEEFGAGLVVEPYLATVLLAGRILAACENSAAQQQWLPAIIVGSVQGALAFNEPQSRFDIHDVKTTATQRDGSYVITGRKSAVFNGGAADIVVLVGSAMQAGLRCLLLTPRSPASNAILIV